MPFSFRFICSPSLIAVPLSPKKTVHFDMTLSPFQQASPEVRRLMDCRPGVLRLRPDPPAIAQPTPIRPCPSDEGLALYQLYLCSLAPTLRPVIQRPAPLFTGSTQWVTPGSIKPSTR